MRTSEILNKAADLIEANGWGQGPTTWDNVGGSGYCLEGGILAAMGTSYATVDIFEFWACPSYRAVQEYLGLPPVKPGTCEETLFTWNDNHSRTVNEVIEVLRATALIEAAKEDASVEVPVTA